MNDIHSRADIEQLVSTFYQKAIKDELIGHFFSEVIPLNLEIHLPIICDFWESTLLGNLVYQSNPMIKHLALAEKSVMNSAHFERWLLLWKQTVIQKYDGPIAKEAINRATQIAKLMQFKIEQHN